MPPGGHHVPEPLGPVKNGGRWCFGWRSRESQVWYAHQSETVQERYRALALCSWMVITVGRLEAESELRTFDIHDCTNNELLSGLCCHNFVMAIGE